MEKSLDCPSEQPVLPASVRQAVGIVILASLQAGCSATPKQVNTQSPVATVEMPTTDPVSMEPVETLQEDKGFTPKKALKLAMVEPLEFIEKKLIRIWRGYGYYECYWKNSEALVITGFSKNLPGYSAYQPKNKFVRVTIVSPDGKSITIKADNTYTTDKTIYEETDRRYYGSSFLVSYVDWGTAEPRYTGGLSYDAYSDFLEELVEEAKEQTRKLEFKEPPHPTCSIQSKPPEREPLECHNFPEDSPLGYAIEDFWRKPGEEWFTFLRTLEKLYTKHDLR